MLIHCSCIVWRVVGRVLCAIAIALGAASVVGVATAAPASAATCAAAGSTGLTASVVATAGQTISTGFNPGIDATGCDIGIYVGPGADNVTITTTVSGANDEGILAEDVTGLDVTGSTIFDNGLHPAAGIADPNAVMLVGVSDSTVSINVVEDDYSGGIGIADDGPVDPGAPDATSGSPVASVDDTINHNTVSDDEATFISATAWNPGGGISGTVIENNADYGAAGVPYGIGELVVADEAAGTSITGTTIEGNGVGDSYGPGITLQATDTNAVISNTAIDDNMLRDNNWGSPYASPLSDAIALIAQLAPGYYAGSISHTTITGNTITGQLVGTWIQAATSTTVGPNDFEPCATVEGFQTPSACPTAGTAVYTVPAPSEGFWLTGSDGGAFAFGNAGYYGSVPGDGISLQTPIVAAAPSRDWGGYYLVGSDGGVFGFGDALYYGSLPSVGIHVDDIAGFATTPSPTAQEGSLPTSEVDGTDGLGYWLTGSDGGVFGFGDAKYYGSLPGLGVHVDDIVGLVPTPDGGGYWLVGSDGGVYAFGDAGFMGSLPGLGVNVNDIVGILATSTGLGYTLVGSDGGVYSFGVNLFNDSLPGFGVHIDDIVGIAANVYSNPFVGNFEGGYWLVGSDGGVFGFWGSGFFDSLPAIGVHVDDVVGMARA